MENIQSETDWLTLLNNSVSYANNVFIHACRDGNLELAKLMCANGANDFNRGLSIVCKKGYVELAKFIATYIGVHPCANNLFIDACQDGNLEIARLMLAKGADLLNEGVCAAYYCGHFDIVKLLYDSGANNFNDGLDYACKNGHLEMAKRMLAKGANNFNRGLWYACRYGNIELVHLMIEKGANTFNDGLRSACDNGHLEIAKLMCEKGATNFNDGLRDACANGHLEIARLMLAKGANNFDEGLRYAVQNGHLEIANLLIEKGATASDGVTTDIAVKLLNLGVDLYISDITPKIVVDRAKRQYNVIRFFNDLNHDGWHHPFLTKIVCDYVSYE